MTPLERALVRLAELIERAKIPYMVIGGMALSFWGYHRATDDVDATVWVDDRELGHLLTALKRGFRLHPPSDPDTIRRTRRIVLETSDGVGADVVLGRVPPEREAVARAASFKLKGHRVRVASLEDLIFWKVVADRPQDHADVAALIRLRGKMIKRRSLDARVREIAKATAQPDLYSRYLSAWRRP